MVETRIFGQKIFSCVASEALVKIEELISTKDISLITGLNVLYVTECDKDKDLSDFYNNCELVTVDGRPLVYLSRFFASYRFPEMVGGPNLWGKLLHYGAEKNLTFYFLGATDEILEKAEETLTRDVKELKIIGKHNGFFDIKGKEMDVIVEELRVLKPDIIYLGLPTPYKEEIAIILKERLDKACIVLIGGMFDVFAGEKKVGNKVVSYLMLDWILRIAQEPRRLFWRYMKSNAYFAYMIMREILRRKKL